MKETSTKSAAPKKVTVKKTPVKKTVSQKRKSNKSALSSQEIKLWKEQMLRKRATIIGNISRMEDVALRSDKRDASADNMADYGTDNYDQDFTLVLIESVEGTVQEIDGALFRIANGTYGICEGCECAIPKARLAALPYAKFCVSCQSERETG